MEILVPVAEAEDVQRLEVTGEGHRDALGAALFVGTGDGAEEAGPGLAGFVVG